MYKSNSDLFNKTIHTQGQVASFSFYMDGVTPSGPPDSECVPRSLKVLKSWAHRVILMPIFY